MSDLKKDLPGLADGYGIAIAAFICGLMPTFHLSESAKEKISDRFSKVQDIDAFIHDIDEDVDSILRDQKWETLNPYKKFRSRSWQRSFEGSTRVHLVARLTKTYKKHTGKRAGYSFSYQTGQPGGPFVDLLVIVYQEARFFKSRETIKRDIRRFRSGNVCS